MMTAGQTELDRIAAAQRVATVEELLYFPKYLQIETVATCNARCIMCPVEEWKRSSLLMDDHLYAKIIDELADFSEWIEMVTPQLDGEPLIDKKFEHRVTMLKDIGIRKVATSSNASLLTPRRSDSLLASGLDEISFSIDGAARETFEAIRVRLNFEECIGNILTFLEKREASGSSMRVRIRMTLMDKNIREYDRFVAFWKQHLRPTDSVYGKLVHNWGSWMDDYRLPGVQDSKTLNALPCQSLWTSLVVLSDGRVPLCCTDFNAQSQIGNLLTTSIKDVWQGSVMQSLRQAHAGQGRQAMPMCVDCNVWDDTSKITGHLGLADALIP